MICPKCGFQNDDTATQCQLCGTALNQSPNNTVQSAPKSYPNMNDQKQNDNPGQYNNQEQHSSQRYTIIRTSIITMGNMVVDMINLLSLITLTGLLFQFS